MKYIKIINHKIDTDQWQNGISKITDVVTNQWDMNSENKKLVWIPFDIYLTYRCVKYIVLCQSPNQQTITYQQRYEYIWDPVRTVQNY